MNENLFNEFIKFYSENTDVINSLAERPFFKLYSPKGFLDRDENAYRPYYKAFCFYKAYASKLVITSRIHAGLPCLGVETPVIFIADDEVTSEKGSFNVPGRLGGLLDFFRIMNYDNNGNFTSDDEVLNTIGIFNTNTKFENKENWKLYAIELEQKCEEFMR